MAKKYKEKSHEYDAYQFQPSDHNRPDWIEEAIAAGRITVHDDHAILHQPSLGGADLRVNPGDWFLREGDQLHSSMAAVFPKFFEEKP